jgi:HAD superfamily hydrolase (TIGR01450 family)
MLDLDGTLFRGQRPTEGAVQALDSAPGRKVFITNNARRSADDVAAHLRELGFTAGPDNVATSGQSAARLLASQLAPGSPVLVVGTEALADEVTVAGLKPVWEFSDDPVAVVQGLSFDTSWSDLAEATLAIRSGALWVAANVDRTLPSERGLLPCNGSMVAALSAATDAEPQVAGKPSPALMKDAVRRGNYRTPLMVGDRMDTDIAGANAAGVPSMMVLTGVNSALDMVYAAARERPTYIGHDLRSLHQNKDMLEVAPQPAWYVEVDDTGVTVNSTGNRQAEDGLSIVRALAAAVWDANFDGRTFTIDAADDAAAEALESWCLMPEVDRVA